MWRKIDSDNLPGGKVFVCKNGELLIGRVSYSEDLEAAIFNSEEFATILSPFYYIAIDELIAMYPLDE